LWLKGQNLSVSLSEMCEETLQNAQKIIDGYEKKLKVD